MSVGQLSALALRSVLAGACKVAGFEAGQMVVEGVSGLLSSRLRDPSQAPALALRKSVERSWRAIEVALAGESLTTRLDRADDRGFRQQIRTFLDALAAELPAHDEAFRRRCLADLRHARRQGVLSAGHPDEQTAQTAAAFARYAEPSQALRAEWEVLDRLAEQVHRAGYEDLGRLVRVRISDGTSLLALSVRFFFRQELAADPKLFQGLTAERIDDLGQQMEGAFTGLNVLLEKQGQRLESLLESIQAMVEQTHGAVLDVQDELRRQGDDTRQQLQELYQAVQSLQARLDLSGRELRPRDTMSIRGDSERQAVRQVAARYRALPPRQRAGMPALLNAIGKLEVAAGELESAQQDFHTVAGLVDDDRSRGEAYFNGYLAALEQGQHDEALKQLRQAVICDRERFAVFAPEKYEPLRILGAGGFGVTFHCRYRATGGDVAVKVLTPEGLERDVSTVFQEAGALDSIQHPAIIRLRECDFADPGRTRPYLVMEYFDGQTLEEYVKTRGPLPVRLFLAVFFPVAEALLAAHERKVLHRDVKPANLLVRPGLGSASTWQVKVIDFGLALKQSVLADASTAARSGRTILGSSIAGTIDYAAPEQMGKIQGVRIGPPADVYGFGRTACFALFGTPNPLRTHWKQVPDTLADLLEACLHEDPRQRLAGFHQVVQRLKAFRQSEAGPARRDRPGVTPTSPPRVPVAEIVEEAVPVTVVPVEAQLVPPEGQKERDRRDRQARDTRAERDEDRPDRRPQRRRPGRGEPRRLHFLVSAFLGAVYLAVTLGVGFSSSEPRPRTVSSKTTSWKDAGKSKADGPASYKPAPSPARTDGYALLSGLCVGVIIGAPCGAIIRSLRGWLFVLVVSLGLGVIVVLPSSMGSSVSGPPFLGGVGMGAILAWMIALPTKLVMVMVRAASPRS
jgi:serine/threonine protein kinase